MSTKVRTSVELLFANNNKSKSHPKQELTSHHPANTFEINITLKPAPGDFWNILEMAKLFKRLKGGVEQNELFIIHNFQLLFGWDKSKLSND